MRNAFSFLLFLSMAACKGQTAKEIKLPPNDFEKAIATPAVQVLDVRTAGEFKSGHIKNALQADWNNQEQFAERIQHVDKNKTVYVYCLAGGRSAAAATWMRNNGFTNVVELQGGINAWKKDSKQLEGLTAEKQMTMTEYTSSIPTDKTVLVDFGAPWCPPCIKMSPVIEEIEKDKNLAVQVIKVDAGIHTDVMTALNIEPIPVFIIYKNGKETWRKHGIVSKEELLTQLK